MSLTTPGGSTTQAAPASVTPSGTVVTETAFGQASNAGAAAAYSRGDHTHGTPAAPGGSVPSATVVTEQLAGQASNAGISADYSRGDHTHGTPAASAYAGFSAQNVVTGSRAINGTVYQNTSGKTMFVVVSINTHAASGQSATAIAATDAANPPVTEVSRISHSSDSVGETVLMNLTFMVLNNNRYKVTGTTVGGGTISLQTWTEWS